MVINDLNREVGWIKQSESTGRPDDLKKAAKEFEAFFLNYLLKTMRESVPKDGLFGGGTGEEIYTSMLDETLSKEMAKKGGIGIAELMLKQLEHKPNFQNPNDK